ncbi:uncharacterized protein L201_002643 [Kwoniella dendrophila CBS 6074]|uniref:Fungal lipase-type domain-containing protein n=1 Tax=Kwoniella dendrophila CBS 6074 TaxID=1295534 RepID=A0AAX4JQQ5_9TREE
MLYHAYLNALRSHGNSALKSIIRLIENPPPTIASHKNIIQEYITSLSQPLAAVVNQPIKEVEIIGHGLGSAIGLLVAMGLGLELDMISLPSLRSKVDINVNLFGLPRVGDIHFASLVDEMLRSTSKTRRPKKDHQSTLQINRITSYFDTITHLPERNLGLSHHTNDEYWIGPNPHLGYFCKSNMWSSSDNMKYEDCSNSVKLGKSSLLDHLGPYGGVWIDSECQRD